jgi:hypothetical protein
MLRGTAITSSSPLEDGNLTAGQLGWLMLAPMLRVPSILARVMLPITLGK